MKISQYKIYKTGDVEALQEPIDTCLYVHVHAYMFNTEQGMS